MNQVLNSGGIGRQRSFVIVGNGIAGVAAAETLRAEEPAAAIAIIANDATPVYYRPALKDYLAGRVAADKLWARPANFYQQQRIKCIAANVVGIDVTRHRVLLHDGRQVGYDRLLLASGAYPRSLSCPGSNLGGVITLRTITNYQSVLSRLPRVKHVVVVGSGTLALESVESLRQRGCQVSHIIRRKVIWSEVLDATASDMVLQQETRDGVDIHLNTEVIEFSGSHGQVTGVVTSSEAQIPCELVLVAIGIEPFIDFIKRSGIACGPGVKVDHAMRTNAPDIFAAGDVIQTTSALSGCTRVIGQWFPAIQQAHAAAYSMLDRLDDGYRPDLYYNATFLYGLGFGSVGLTNAHGYGLQEIVAPPQPRSYRKVLLKDGRAVGLLSLGDRRQALAFKRAIDHGVNLLPVASTLFAEHFDVNQWLDNQAAPPPVLGTGKIFERREVGV
ncbi:MAG: FAD-dependent oxidoreductase [Ktedonobacteraceae bacterium]